MNRPTGGNMRAVMTSSRTNRPRISFLTNRSLSPIGHSVFTSPRKSSVSRCQRGPDKPKCCSRLSAQAEAADLFFGLFPGGRHGAGGGSPVRRPDKRHERDGDVRLARLKRNGFQFLLKWIGRRSECVTL